MSITSLNGNILERMLRNGLKNIQKHEIEVNDMNVFPVPDGDTGSNMRMTLQNGITVAESTKDLGAYLKQVKKGMLLGARGNSGVILSQLFAGMSESLERDSIVNVREFIESLEEGYKTAFKSVVNPVQGTILTVAKDGFKSVAKSPRPDSFEELLQNYISAMKKSLSKTPELLPVLKESGVLDSGAAGYIYIFEGMYKGLCGEEIVVNSEEIVALPNPAIPLKTDKFNAESKFELGYCTEFLLQLLKNPLYNQHFNLEEFTETLKTLGDSLVVLQDESRVKVHIHTKNPAPVISFAQNYGEFVTFKMENMQLQHNQRIFSNENNNEQQNESRCETQTNRNHEERTQTNRHCEERTQRSNLIDEAKIESKVPHKDVAIIAVANGSGISELYKSLGCDVVLEGGATMNVSSEEFLNEYKKLDANCIIVLPNNKNIFQAAKQAVELSGQKNIRILESQNIAEGYYALAMGNSDNGDIDFKIRSMQEGIDSVDVVSVTISSKDYSHENVSCKKGEFIALLNGELVADSANIEEAVKIAVEKIPNLSEKESCIVFQGSHTDEKMNDAIENCLEKIVPEIETSFISAGQELFHYIIGF